MELTVTRRSAPLLATAGRQLSLKERVRVTQVELRRRLELLAQQQTALPSVVPLLLSLSVVLVLDCTSTMAAWRDALVDSLPMALAQLDSACPSGHLRVGFVGYRDVDDSPRFFTQPCLPRAQLPDLQGWVRRLCMEGGGASIPDDLIGGLHEAVGLLQQWPQPPNHRAVLVLTDSPCHGAGLHDFDDDAAQLQAMAKDDFTLTSCLQHLGEGGAELGFLRVNSACDRMLRVMRNSFEGAAQSKRRLMVLDVSAAEGREQRLTQLETAVGSFLTHCLHAALLRLPLQT